MIIIGLLGGIASGKSAVAAELATLGAVVLDADQAAHEVINLPTVQQTLVDRWGKTIINADGEIDRTVVAQRVFSGRQADHSAELRFLEETLHPLIRERFVARLAKQQAEGTEVAVIDAPLLLEAGWGNLCDHLLFVDSPRAERLGRAKLRKWTEAEFSKREASQMPIAEKRGRSSHILTNAGTLERLRDQVRTFWASFEAF